MKKRFTFILASMFLTLGAWAQTTTLSFVRDGQSVTVNSDNTDVTAEFISITGATTSFKGTTGSYLTNKVLCPDKNANASSDARVLTFKVNGLSSISKMGVTVLGLNGQGGYQNADTYVRTWSIVCSVSSSVDGTATELATFEQNVTGSAPFELLGDELTEEYVVGEEESVYLTLSITPTQSTYGCFIGLSQIVLYSAVEGEELTYTLTDELGSIYEGSYVGVAGETLPTVTGVEGYTLTDESWDGNAYSATIAFPFPISNAETTNWTFIKSDGMTDGAGYFYTNEDKVVTKSPIAANELTYLPVAVESEIKKWQWAIYPSFSEGRFTFQIKNAANGKFVSGTQEADHVTMAETGANFCWGVCIGNNGFYLADNTNIFFAANSSGAGERNAILWNKSGSSHKGGNLNFFEAAYTVTITEAGAATLFTPWEVTIPTGVTAKYPTAAANGKLECSELEDVIPANNAVILTGNAGGTYAFNVSNTSAAALENNLLFGYSTATSSADTGIGAEGNVYALGRIDDVTAFYHFVGDTYAAYKAYLRVPANESSIGYRFDEEGTTGIEDAELTIDNGQLTIYDLQGRRVEKMEKGIYIVNGKKVIK